MLGPLPRAERARVLHGSGRGPSAGAVNHVAGDRPGGGPAAAWAARVDVQRGVAAMFSEMGFGEDETPWARAAVFPTWIPEVGAVEVRCTNAAAHARTRAGPGPGSRLLRPANDHARGNRDRAGSGFGRDRPSPLHHREPDA